MTHGDCLIRDEQNTVRVWLHAFHTGHADLLVKLLTTLPEWVAGLDPADAPRSPWWIERFQKYRSLGDPDNMIERLLHDHIRCDPFTLAGLVVGREFDHWLPCAEEDAPWHKVGDPPSVEVVCHFREFVGYTGYTIQYRELNADGEEIPKATLVNYPAEVVRLLGERFPIQTKSKKQPSPPIPEVQIHPTSLGLESIRKRFRDMTPPRCSTPQTSPSKEWRLIHSAIIHGIETSETPKDWRTLADDYLFQAWFDASVLLSDNDRLRAQLKEKE